MQIAFPKDLEESYLDDVLDYLASSLYWIEIVLQLRTGFTTDGIYVKVRLGFGPRCGRGRGRG